MRLNIEMITDTLFLPQTTLYLYTISSQNSNLPSRLLLVLPLFLSLLSPAISFQPQDTKLPATQAQKLIRDLNLFPKHPVNIVDRDATNTSAARSKIVEKPFRFPNFVDSDGVSVEELGHHAGYYQIKHSHEAKYIL